jgi:hypothetical protein
MANTSNEYVVNKANLDTLKWETAKEIGSPLKQGYNGDITSREAGHVGGQMVKKMIQYAEQNMR